MRDHLGNFVVSGDLGFARGVLLLEDCEGTFTWVVSGTGGDDVHGFATAAAFMGLNVMQLKTRKSGAAANDYLTVSKPMGFSESGLCVLRARVAVPVLAVVGDLTVAVLARNGTRRWQGELVVDPNTPKVEYINSGGTWTAVAALAQTPVVFGFVTIELALDLTAMQYLEGAWNGVRASLAGVSMYDVAADTSRGLTVAISVRAAGAAAAEIYVDSVYVGEFMDL